MSNTNYNELSRYLSDKINTQNVNEGLLDKIKGGTGLLGWIGGFFANFTGVSETSGNGNKMIEEYRKLMNTEIENEKKRLEAEQKSEEDLEIAKLNAEFEHNQNQLDIASKNRVKAYKARAKQISDYSKQLKSNKLLYSKEENEAIINKIREAGKELGAMDNNPLTEMADLAMIIGVNEDGSVRTYDDIKSVMENEPDGELAKRIKEYNKLAEKHGKSIIGAMSSDEFKEAFTNKCAEVRKTKDLETKLKEAQQAQDEFNKKTKAVGKINEIQQAHEDAKKAHEEAETKLNELTDNKTNPFIPEGGYNSETGELTKECSKEDFNTAIKKLANKHDNETDFKKALQDAGVSEDYITSLFKNGDEDTKFEFTPENISNRIESDECKNLVEDAIKSVKEKQESNIKEAKTTVEQAKTTLDKTIDTKTAKIEDIKKFVEEHDNNPESLEAIDAYEKMSDKDRESGEYDPNSKVHKEAKAKMIKGIKDIEKSIDTNKKNQDLNKRAAENARNKMEGRKRTAVDDDIKDEVEKLTDGLEGGEVRTDKGIGFWDGENFVKKPKPGASNEEKEEYIQKRKEYALSLDPNSIGNNDNDIKSVVKNDDGTYTITYNNGKTEETDDKETAALAKAEVISREKAQAAVIGVKQDAAEVVKNCIKDGKLDVEEIKDLLDSDNDDDKEKIQTLKYLLNNEKDIDSFFKGVDLDGDVTAEEIKKAVGDSKEELKKHFEDFEDVEFKKRDKSTDDTEDSDYEDVKDDDEDANDDKEYDSDEEETDENGNKTKKKLKNPAKIWHRKKRKNGKGMTKSYYNGDDSISADEYKQRMENYKKAKKKSNNTSEGISSKLRCNSIDKYIVESDNVFNSEYNKLRTYIINNIDK